MARRSNAAALQQDALIAMANARARAPGSGGSVTAVTAALPLVSTGGPTPIIGLAPGCTVVTTAANAATLSALALTPILVGAMAYVQTYGAFFALQPASALAADVVLASSNAALVWSRTVTAVAATSQKQTAWFVDPVAGNNENTGLTTGTALASKSEIVRRWGTNSPTLNGINVLITYLNSDVAGGNDPGNFSPQLVNGATLKHFAVLPAPSFTGTLLAVTAKNRAGNQPLQATFTTMTGAIAADLLLVNATRGNSRAIVQRNSAGVTWQLSQPFAPYTGIGPPANTEVDTWADGDAITGYALLSIDLSDIAGLSVEIQGGVVGHIVQQMNVVDPGGPGAFNAINVDGRAIPVFVECVISRVYSQQQAGQLRCQVSNCSVSGISVGVATVNIGGGFGSGGPTFAGGIIGTQYACAARNIQLKSDVIVAASLFAADIAAAIGICWDGPNGILRGDNEMGATVNYGSGGQINAVQGTVQFTGTAVAAFPLSAGLLLNGVGTGYSNATAAGLTTTHGAIALTPANIDAAAGAAGFGGYAYGGGAAFIKAGAQP